MSFRLNFKYKNDAQLVSLLLSGDEGAIGYVFYDRFMPLLTVNASKSSATSVMPYDDLVQELYLYMSRDDWRVLRRYNPDMPFVTWLSVVSYRFFKDFSRSMIDSSRKVPISDMEGRDEEPRCGGEGTLMGDLMRVLPVFEPPRDREVLQAALVDDEEPENTARRLGVTVDNLYNIKRRALARLIKNYLNDYKD